MPPLGADFYTELIASTREKLEPNLVDQVFSQHPTLDILKQNTSSHGGRSLVLNLELDEDDNTVITDESGTFSLARSPDIIGAADFRWSMPYVSKMRLDWYTLQQNTGKEALVNLVETHLENVKKSHAKKLVTTLHKTSAQLAGEFSPLDRLVGNATTDAAANHKFGGIQTWTGTSPRVPVEDHVWQAERLTSSRAAESIRKAVRKLRNRITIRSGGYARITHIIAGLNIFEEYEDSFDDKVRYVNFDKGQTRFRAIYDGDIEVRLDPDCNPDRAYFLSGDNLRFRHLNGNFMAVQKAQVITGTLDMITPFASVLLIGTNARRNHGLLIRTA